MLGGEKVFLTNRGNRVAQLAAAAKPPTRGRGRGVLKQKINFYPDWDSREEDQRIENMFESIAE